MLISNASRKFAVLHQYLSLLDSSLIIILTMLETDTTVLIYS